MTETAFDEVGYETLERFADAMGRYNALLFEQFAPFVGDRVLEIGSGIGNISTFLADRERVVLSDVSPVYLGVLRKRFHDHPNVAVARWDLGEEPPPELEPGSFDTILCSNVLEHIEDDHAALDRMRRLLTPDGRLLLLVPAHQLLYNGFDVALGHYRRYARKGLRSLLHEMGFAPERIWYFNVLGALGWFVNGTILRKSLLPKGQMKLFDLLVPIVRAERFLRPPFGVSVLSVSRSTRGR